MLLIGFVTVALAETGVTDCPLPDYGSARLIDENVPQALACADVSLSGEVAIDEPYELSVENGCAFVVRALEVDCDEADQGSDANGCGLLRVAAGDSADEVLEYLGGDDLLVELEWFDPAVPEVVATATWSVDATYEPRDTGPGLFGGRPLARRCGCSTGSPGLVLASALFGLLAVRRRA